MATTISIKNLPEGYQSIITNGKHTIVGDEPLQSKGTDLGLSPSELVLSGLAMCKVATIRFIARKNDWNIGEVKAELSQEVIAQAAEAELSHAKVYGSNNFKTTLLRNTLVRVLTSIAAHQEKHPKHEGALYDHA